MGIKGNILFIGDIHGRTIWKDIVKQENWDYCIFVGDYYDPYEDIGMAVMHMNFYDILDFKNLYSDRVTLLLGNHDYHYLINGKETYSRYNQYTVRALHSLFEPLWKDHELQIAWQYRDLIVTHAGISEPWVKKYGVSLENLSENINQLSLDSFSFLDNMESPIDVYGTSKTQSPLWIRPQTLVENKIKGYRQVVGHTQTRSLFSRDGIWFVDTLGSSQEYLVYNTETDQFIIKSLNQYHEIN